MSEGDVLWTFILVGFAYLLGALPFGVWIARLRGIEIQEHGSGNTGATNVARTLGWKVGAAVLVLDAAKGAVPTYLALHHLPAPALVALVGFVAILGHCLSPFLGGKGGKGVATALGVFLVLDPHAVALAVVAFVAGWRLTRVPAVGSLAGIATIFLAELIWERGPYAVMAAATFVWLVWTHRTNLAKLIHGVGPVGPR
jgi:acyl phosphate:glycerol-3-phosphate acyltransferase